MNNEQMKRIGMFANFDGAETVDVTEEPVKEPNPDNAAPESSIDKFLEDNGINTNKLPEDGLFPEISEQPGEGGEEEYELVKEKKPAVTDKRRKLVRLALVAFALFVAYKLFFSKRR